MGAFDVQIAGDFSAVKKTLLSVSYCLLDNPKIINPGVILLILGRMEAINEWLFSSFVLISRPEEGEQY